MLCNLNNTPTFKTKVLLILYFVYLFGSIIQVNQSCINDVWETCTHSRQGIHTYLQLQLHVSTCALRVKVVSKVSPEIVGYSL